MRNIARAAGAVALALSVGGCWLQPEADAGRTNWNQTEQTLTSANVGELVEVWRAPIGRPETYSGVVRPQVSSGGTVFVADALGTVTAVSSATGAQRWSTQVDRTVGHIAWHDGDLLVNYVTRDANPDGLGVGGQVRLDPATGAERSRTVTAPAYGLAVADGRPAVESGTVLGALGVIRVDWAFSAAAACNVVVAGACPGPWAVVGDHLAWSLGGEAMGYRTPCLPGPALGACGPAWRNDLDGRFRSTSSDVAAVGDDRVAYTLKDGFTVLDVATGEEVFTVTNGQFDQELAVAGDTILAVERFGELQAYSVTACEAGPCTPLWSVPSGEPAQGDYWPSTPVVAGDVVYVATRDTVEAFPLAGCGAAVCSSIASLAVDGRTSGQLLVDGGRVVVGVTGLTDEDGNHVVAFGLSP